MNHSLQKVFKKETQTVEITLCTAIWADICKRQKRKEVRVMWTYLLVGASSIVGLVFVIKNIFAQFTQSGFYEYISLLSSDGSVVTTYWKEFILTLTESVPVTSIIICLVLIAAFVAALRQISYQYRGQLLTA